MANELVDPALDTNTSGEVPVMMDRSSQGEESARTRRNNNPINPKREKRGHNDLRHEQSFVGSRNGVLNTRTQKLAL